MSQFPQVVIDFWQEQFPLESALYQDEKLTISTNPLLEEARRLQVLDISEGPTKVVLTPQLADSLGLAQNQAKSAEEFQQRLKSSSIKMHEADDLLYIPTAAAEVLRDEQVPDSVRRLTSNDAAAFSEFTSSASAQDLDDAYVELDHWVVFGAFEAGKLVCVASMYPWQKSKIADIGVLTLESARGKGHGRRVIRAISKNAYDQGYEPQYRCHLDNLGSVGLARSSGFVSFATWEALSSTGAEE
ncbi:hypothetical protein K4F52_001218 [Lecanicillium sp. MT-2017a]|nr:hypothetical protein K4F52_001218 [Lecanicillium sp. MT-2017a]